VPIGQIGLILADNSEIEVWGDGKQTRSSMYIDDCVEGIYRIMRSDHGAPLNLGTDELVSVDELVDIISRIAGETLVMYATGIFQHWGGLR
jgi:GDP-D-mannose 3',5'-epimerase